MKTETCKNSIRIVSGENKNGLMSSGIVITVITVLLFACEMALPAKNLTVLITAVICALVFGAAALLVKKIRFSTWVLCGLIAAMIAAAVFVLRRLFVNGSIAYLNCLISNWNEKNNRIEHFFMTGNVDVQLALCFFVAVSIALISLWTGVIAACGKNAVIIALNLVMFSLFTLSVSRLPIWIAIWMWIITLISATADTDLLNTARKNGKTAAAAAAILMAASLAVVAAAKLMSQDTISSWQEAIASEAERLIYGESDLTDGDLTDIGPNPDSDEVRLSISTAYNGTYLLRGYVGSSYTGHSWEDLDEEAYSGENLKMHQWLIDVGNSPVNSLGQALSLTKTYERDGSAIETYSYKVKNESAFRKYVYLPYAIGNVTFKYTDNIDRDLNVKNPVINMLGEYDADAVTLSLESYETLADNGAMTDADLIRANQLYYTAEQTYRDFVLEHYLVIPEDVRAYFDKELMTAEPEGAYGTIEFIRSYLSENMEYMEKPERKYNGEDDFVTELLSEGKQGYSVHFATAAALMFRYFGYPSRYVEGYRIPEGSSEAAAKDAHAWVEIYRYGFGWVPVEVTPGFYSVPEHSSSAIQVTEVRGEDGRHINAPDFSGMLAKENDDLFQRIVIWGSFLLLLLLILAVLIMVLRRRIILGIRHRRSNTPDRIRNIRYMMRFIRRNSIRSGIQVREDFPDTFAKSMDDFFGDATKLTFAELMSHVYHAECSADGADHSDESTVRQYMNGSAMALYMSAGTLRRIKLKMLDVVC